MGRSKEMGKGVEELTSEELRRELVRCRTLVRVYGNKISAKLLRKRLFEIERRMGREGVGE